MAEREWKQLIQRERHKSNVHVTMLALLTLLARYSVCAHGRAMQVADAHVEQQLLASPSEKAQAEQLLVRVDGADALARAQSHAMAHSGCASPRLLSQNAFLTAATIQCRGLLAALSGVRSASRLPSSSRVNERVEKLLQELHVMHTEPSDNVAHKHSARGSWFEYDANHVTLQVTLMPFSHWPGFSSIAQRSLVSTMGLVMQYMQPEPLDVNVAGENMLTIRVNCSVETVDASSRWLAAQEYVNQVNPAVVAFPSNSDAVPVARGRGEALQEPIRTEYPSLDGEGEVVVASDTGVDRKSCFFSSVNGESKIVAYINEVNDVRYGDTTDASGHGTHVVGSFVGRPPSGKHNGSAPGAHVLFYDFQDGTSSGLQTPKNLYQDYFQHARGQNANAKVFSNSWGFDPGSYTSQSSDVDKYLGEQDSNGAVVCFSVGNLRDPQPDGTKEEEITSPGNAKSAVSVGASVSSSAVPPAEEYLLKMTTNSYDGFAFKVVQSTFGPQLDITIRQTESSTASVSFIDDTACGQLTQDGLDGRIVVVERGDCTFVKKARNLQNAGALAMLLISDLPCGTWIRMGAEGGASDIDIPSAVCSRNDCQRLREHLDVLPGLRVSAAPVSIPPEYDHLASFSSRGLTQDGRYKPDIVAPGTGIQSASVTADGADCDPKTLSGTSMATPIAAGTLTLVHEYLKNAEQYFANASNMELTRSNPRGQLVKAIAVNGAEPMQGFAEQGIDTIPLESTPSCEQGFGRLNLSASVPFDNIPGSPSFAHFVDDQSISSTDQVHVYCFEARGPGELRATLTWADELIIESNKERDLQESLLINNLDLSVNATGGVSFPLTGKDDLNTVERIIVPQVEAGVRLAVSVSASKSVSEQHYALAITGNLRHIQPFSSTEVSDCTDSGTANLSKSNTLTTDGSASAGQSDVVRVSWRTLFRDFTANEANSQFIKDFKNNVINGLDNMQSDNLTVIQIPAAEQGSLKLDSTVELASEYNQTAIDLVRQLRDGNGPLELLGSNFFEKNMPIVFNQVTANIDIPPEPGTTLGVDDDVFRRLVWGSAIMFALSIGYSLLLYTLLIRTKIDSAYTISKGLHGLPEDKSHSKRAGKRRS